MQLSNLRGPVVHRPSERFSRLPLVTFLLLLLGACHREGNTSKVRVSYEITPQPVRVGQASVALHLKDLSGKPASNAHINLEADMAHPGMAPIFGEAKEDAPGEYRGEIDFNMPGDWVLLVHGKLSDGSNFERQIAVEGVEGK
ncbi:MAG TPA: FixH family protein [Terriglobales bacterium]